MITDTTWIDAYRARRELIVLIGYRWDQGEAVWRKGKKVLSDERIDRIALEKLHAYVERPPKGRTA